MKAKSSEKVYDMSALPGIYDFKFAGSSLPYLEGRLQSTRSEARSDGTCVHARIRCGLVQSSLDQSFDKARMLR